MEEAKKEKRESDRNQSKQEGTDRHSLDGEHCSVVSKSVPTLICVSSHHQVLTFFNNQHSFYKTCLFTNTICCLTLTFHSTKIAISRLNCDSQGCFLLWKVGVVMLQSLSL